MDYSKVGRNRVYNLALEEQIQPDRFYPKNNLQTTMISSYTRLFQLLEKHLKQINRKECISFTFALRQAVESVSGKATHILDNNGNNGTSGGEGEETEKDRLGIQNSEKEHSQD